MRSGARREILAFGLAGFLLALSVRLSTLDWLTLLGDEWLTAHAAGMDVPQLIRDRLAAGHSPFYFLLVKAAGLDLSAGDFALRLPTAIVDALAAAILAGLARSLSGRVGATMAIALYGFAPTFVHLGQTARPYPLLFLFVAIALAGAVAVARAPRATAAAFAIPHPPGRPFRAARRSIAAIAVGLVGAGYTMNVGMVAAVAMPLALLLVPGCRRVPRLFRLLIATTAVVWFALAPGLIAQAPSLLALAEGYWAETYYPLSLATLPSALGRAYGFASPYDPDIFWRGVWDVPLAILVLSLAFSAALVGARRGPVAFLSLFGLAVPLLLVAISTIQSVLVARYFAISLLPLFLLAAQGAKDASAHLVGRLIVGFLVVGVALQGADILVAKRKPDWRIVGQFLDRHSYGVVRGIADRPLEAGLVARYAPAGLALDLRVEPEALRHPDEAARLLEREPFVWLIEHFRNEAAVRARLDLVACAWHHSGAKFILVARDRANLPPALRACRPDNGSVTGAEWRAALPSLPVR